MKTILVVCTGNICRSPMAAAILRKRMSEHGLGDQVEIPSAGTFAEPGYRASRFAAAVLAQRGTDLSGHRSQGVTTELLDKADIVLVMEEAHRRSIFYLAPHHLAKVFLRSEMAGKHDDIGDPYGGVMEEYVHTAELLEHIIDEGLPQILTSLGLPPKA